MNKLVLKSLAGAVVAMSAAGAYAFDQDVTNNVIFGSGVTNGNFTVNNKEQGSVEIGLRARVRFDANNQPTNANANFTNDDSTNQYSGPIGVPTPGFSWAPGSLTAAKWNFDWSINTSPNGQGSSISRYTYLLEMDYDAGLGTSFYSFDPLAVAFADHSFGNNSTAMGAGVEAVDAGGFTTLKGSSTLVQNSWNYDFFDNFFGMPFDPNANGTYTIRLSAFLDNILTSTSEIDVIVGTGGSAAVPEPGSLALIGLALTGLAVSRRRKQAK